MRFIINFLWKVPRKILYSLHKLSVRRKIQQKDVSIIAQNCIGGVIYSIIGQEFLSPTINMFIENENFIKLVNNLQYYMSITPRPLLEEYIDPINTSVRYPKIAIDDIEICCLHYKNCQEAIVAWERRKNRINYNKILVIANSWNMRENETLVSKICKNKKYTTICFTYGQYNFNNCIQMEGDYWYLDERKIIRPNITDFKVFSAKRYFEDYIDLVKLFKKFEM